MNSCFLKTHHNGENVLTAHVTTCQLVFSHTVVNVTRVDTKTETYSSVLERWTSKGQSNIKTTCLTCESFGRSRDQIRKGKKDAKDAFFNGKSGKGNTLHNFTIRNYGRGTWQQKPWRLTCHNSNDNVTLNNKRITNHYMTFNFIYNLIYLDTYH